MASYDIETLHQHILQILLSVDRVCQAHDITLASPDFSFSGSWKRTAVIVIYVVLVAPVTEELLCRGLIFCGLYRRSRIWAYALSMLVFSLLHVYGSMLDQPFGVSLVNLVVYLPAGFALAWSYERSGSIFSAMILHTVINSFALLLQALVTQL